MTAVDKCRFFITDKLVKVLSIAIETKPRLMIQAVALLLLYKYFKTENKIMLLYLL